MKKNLIIKYRNIQVFFSLYHYKIFLNNIIIIMIVKIINYYFIYFIYFILFLLMFI